MACFAPTTLTTGKNSRNLKFHALVVLSAGLLATSVLTGCGFGRSAVSTEAIATPALSGKTFGGPNPIIGATVTLYTTGNSSGQSTGYGIATNRQQTTTTSSGNFNFAGGYTCPVGQFAYIVSAGGNTGASNGASGAQASANWDGVISVAIGSGGTNYSATPMVTINDPTGTGATATATVSSGVITKLNLGTQGSGYTSPTISISDATGSGATGTATAGTGGTITGISVTSAGSGYTSATVTITPTDGHGSGATATANFSGPGNTSGGVTSIVVNNGGSGYDAVPTVTISAPTSNNPTNNNAVLAAALGRCEDLYQNTSGGAYTGSSIYISEISTVAAAYALGHFSTVSGTGSSTIVSIGTDAANNAAQMSGVSTGCVANGGSCTTTQTAGLAHAFLNAANLVNVFQNPITNNGANTTVTPAYSTYLTGYTAATPVVPQQLINTLGNILVACVNSAGGASGDGSACGNIFAATTIPAAIAPTYTAATPTNTFTAMVNLAYNPTLSGSTSAVSNFFNIASGFTSVYSPSLTGIGLSSNNTLLNDYSIAIQYPASGTTSGLGYTPTTTNTACSTAPCQGLAFPTSMALDINDNLYIANQSTAAGAVPVNLFMLTSTGRLQSVTANGITLKQGLGLSVDALGNGYFVNGSSSASSVMGIFTTSNGTALSQYSISAAGAVKSYATAVDRANNVWVAAPNAGSNSVFMSPATGSSFSAKSNVTFTAAGSPPDAVAIAIDPNQNVWVAGAAGLGIVQNTGTLAAPTYTNSTAIAPSSITGTTMSSITFAGSSPYIGYVGNYTTNPGVQPFTPTFNNAGAGPGIASAAGGTLATGGILTGSDIIEADGAGVIWNASANTHSLSPLYNPTATSVSYKIIPCLGTAGGASTTCVDGLTSSLKADFLNIDSTGSIWVGAQAGALIQVIGAATPVWPLLSLGLTGAP